MFKFLKGLFGAKPEIITPTARMTKADITHRVTSHAKEAPHNYRHPHEENWPSGKPKRNKLKGHR